MIVSRVNFTVVNQHNMPATTRAPTNMCDNTGRGATDGKHTSHIYSAMFDTHLA
jgi:hypothetical protein